MIVALSFICRTRFLGIEVKCNRVMVGEPAVGLMLSLCNIMCMNCYNYVRVTVFFCKINHVILWYLLFYTFH